MNFLTGLTQVRTFVGKFVGKTTTTNSVVAGGIDLVRYLIRLALLGMIMYIFIWWPVDEYTTEGFDQWSQRMTDLPATVWGLITAIILFWATSEVMATRAATAARQQSVLPPQLPTDGSFIEEGEDFLTMGMGEAPRLDGRFANVMDDDEEIFMTAGEPNPVIEEWRNAPQ